MRSEFDINETITEYADMVKRICICHMKSSDDIDDVFQNIFIKYMMHDEDFTSENHKKAWLIRVAVNACKDYLRTHFWKKADPIDVLGDIPAEDNQSQSVLEAVLALPEKYKDTIYLHYYEGYTAAEIAGILGKKENTVYSLLSRGRDQLKTKLGGGIDE